MSETFKVTSTDASGKNSWSVHLTPDEVWKLYGDLIAFIESHAWPAVEVALDLDDCFLNGNLDVSEVKRIAPVHLVCPRCNALDSICEKDVSTRDNRLYVELPDENVQEDANGAWATVSDGDGEYHTLTFICSKDHGGCGMPVDVDADLIDVSWG